MRSRLALVFALGCGGSAPAPVAAPSQPAATPPEPVVAEPSQTTGDPATRSHPTFGEGPPISPPTPAANAWINQASGRRAALVSGSIEGGPFEALVEIKAGSAPFWHMHGRDVRMVVVSGTIEYVESGQPPHILAPGAYVDQPGGYKHTENCKAGADCVLYVRGERGFVTKAM